MRPVIAFETAAPFGEINTTPLIDVMLVLLIMFIITIPVQTHSVKLDLPRSCVGCPIPNGTVNVITISPTDQFAWNDAPVSKQDLKYLLNRTQQMRPAPELHLRPDGGARYGTVDEVLAMIKRANVRRFGFVGNEAYANL